ncbi:MoxR family ATPase [Candidatus Bipolaricaulota bacterium]|nr:MoxR family ATPase [Candidatus Bipolaricaulota bacterium]HBR10308.1 magnesium chelatase [Candidatus Acetothermia bacterium]
MKILQIKELSDRIITEVERAIIGKRNALRLVMTGIFSGGHILFEDFPGLAKTLVAKSFAQVLGLSFRRIQFTPDLLPSDITGTHIFDRNNGTFTLRPGPIFANIVLADEINRATPKTQSALLEAMQEFQVTLEGESRLLSLPFIVIATQNPIEYEGTFPLPEAQIDRFILRLEMGYPDMDSEIEILSRRHIRKEDEVELSVVTNKEQLLEARQAVESVFIDPDIERYIVQLVQRTRSDANVYVGASPRGALALLKLTRALAAIEGRDYVLPDDVKELAVPALAHRLILSPDLWAKKLTATDVIETIIRTTAVPKIS